MALKHYEPQGRDKISWSVSWPNEISFPGDLYSISVWSSSFFLLHISSDLPSMPSPLSLQPPSMRDGTWHGWSWSKQTMDSCWVGALIKVPFLLGSSIQLPIVRKFVGAYYVWELGPSVRFLQNGPVVSTIIRSQQRYRVATEALFS